MVLHACHFLNHALGLISLDAAEAALKVAAAVWQSWPGTVLLFGHVVPTRMTYSWSGEAAQYQRIVANLARDGATGWQLALLAPAWLHGCMGLNVALRHRAWFERWRVSLIGFVIALPLCAAAGYWSMTRQVAALGMATTATAPTAPQRVALGELRGDLLTGYFCFLSLVLVSRSWRDWRTWRSARRTP